MTYDPGHALHREVVETRQYVLTINEDGELVEDGSGALMDFEEKATIECSCGERFRKDETALAHLQEEDALDE